MKTNITVLIWVIGFAICGPALAQNKILVTAHRGDWRNAPENSLKAFEYATAMGVDIIELDLKKTKDGEIIIMHDATIDRTTNGKGKPADYTLDEIRKFGLKNGLGRVTNNHIPTLKEVMIALKNSNVKINLDKSYDYYVETYAILKETGTIKQAIFKAEVTFDELKQRYPQLIDSIIYMPVVNLNKPEAKKIIIDYLKNMKPYAFELNFTKDTSSVLSDNKFITQTGAKVWINSLWASLNAGHDDDTAIEDGNLKDSWDWIIAHGATIIQTDRPEQMLKYLRKKQLHK
ncbi:glycerophosphodiester phosphodiesterase family protein [Mucilaginibacter sp.]|jgi:glycerophosphoryl diester phosphodiesterase|uniref:glycerophosphodiester phosphodiesterase family protein n=1 Tax=Mucilaginibacter sp. TaxID=1882438 RepID=UPI00356A0892